MLPHEVQQLVGNSAFSSSDPLFHSDTIHHVEFDFYGQRVVTVSSDKLVCIWDKETQGTWKRSASWKKHGGAVWKARFAHPEFGQILATCSFDNTIQVFDKDAVDVMDARSSMSASDFSNGWVCRTVLRQSTSSITDIQFAPHYLGLQLAACTSSGRLIIYEAEDIMTLDNWNVIVDSEVCQHRLCSLSWSRSRFDPPYIALSSDDADAPSDEKVFLFRVVNTGIFPARVINSTSSESSSSKEIKQKPRDYKFLFEDPVSMIAFGPSCGLGMHKLAIAVGVRLLIYQLQLTMTDDHNQEESHGSTEGIGENQIVENTTEQSTIQQHFVIKLFDTLEKGNSQLVRFAWNILGDIISAVYADGLVRIWRYTYSNQWCSISTITPPAEQEKNPEDVYY